MGFNGVSASERRWGAEPREASPQDLHAVLPIPPLPPVITGEPVITMGDLNPPGFDGVSAARCRTIRRIPRIREMIHHSLNG